MSNVDTTIFVYLAKLVCVAGVCMLEIGAMSLTVKSITCISMCMYLCCCALLIVHRYQLSAFCECVSSYVFFVCQSF